MTTSPVKVVFFDAVGTLFWVRGSVGEIYQQFAAKAGVQVDATALDQSFMKAFRAAPRAAFPRVSSTELPELEYAWWKTIAQNSFKGIGVFEQLGDFETFFRPLFDHFALADPWVVYPEVYDVLQGLQDKGVELGIVSNFDTRLHAVLKALALEPYFSSLTLSTQTGFAKPSVEVFQAALGKHHCSPLNAIHVGDDWAEDYQGAIAAGLKGIWLNRNGAKQVAAWEIPDLTELTTIVPAQQSCHDQRRQ
jgi:putative hydrolase of the HAD superfamily